MGHSHTIQPSFTRIANPTSLAQDAIYNRVEQGWQFQNLLINRIYYDNRDNVFNPTTGYRAEFSILLGGTVLGGNDHFIKYEPKLIYYWWIMDYTIFGLIRKNILRRWRIVLEHRVSMGFTQILGPVYNTQDRLDNPYIEPINYYLLGRYESLRGWSIYDDPDYPLAWRNGASHRITFGTELRIPLEPSILWFVLFVDAGALFEDPVNVLIDNPTVDQNLIQSIHDSRLARKNISLSYFKYSWGFGFRIQIPILPLRFFFARKVIWDTIQQRFREVDGNFQFEFAIGDFRY